VSRSRVEKAAHFLYVIASNLYRVVDPAPIVPQLNEDVNVVVLPENLYVKAQFIKDIERIGGKFMNLADGCTFHDIRTDYPIADKSFFSKSMRDFIKRHPQIQYLMLVHYNSIDVIDIPNVRVISKPVYSLSLYNVTGIQDIELDSVNVSESERFFFVAPDAHVPVVDYNTVNLTVATGLFEPLKMKMDTARYKERTCEAPRVAAKGKKLSLRTTALRQVSSSIQKIIAPLIFMSIMWKKLCRCSTAKRSSGRCLRSIITRSTKKLQTILDHKDEEDWRSCMI